MRRRPRWIAASAVAAILPAGQMSAAGHTTTLQSGVYSEAQARRGESGYLRACERCHAVDLRGDLAEEIPALAEDDFLRRWDGRTLDDLFLKVSRTMPATAPASLTAREYIDIVAYLLKANGFRSGPEDLDADSARLQRIAFGAAAPQARVADEPTEALTALDYFEIRQLNARFVHGLDSAADQGTLFAGVFTADGVYVDAAGAVHEGRAALAEYARRDPDRRKGPTNVKHYIANDVVEPGQGSARGRGYVLMATRGQVGATTTAAARDDLTDGGQYWDELVRTREGWRIRRRTLVRPGASPAVPTVLPPWREPEGPIPPPPSVPSLTADDYTEIYQLYAKYGYTFDSGADKGYAWANLFTPDGVHVNAINPLEYLKGRDINALFAYGGLRLAGGFVTLNPAPAPKNPLSIAHILTSILLEPTEEGVVGKAYRLTGAVTPDGRVTLAPGGVYFDLLVRTAEGWRYQESWYLRPEIAVPQGAKRFVSPHRAN
ncbi:MAG: nuclear transport factor 2 family protein [Acidobacteria bacterium]|nr:nuclear transport factor 2 family protein [Acidobacteriota bacterium]